MTSVDSIISYSTGRSHGSTSTKILRLPLKLNIFVLQDAQSTRRQVLPLGHYGSDSGRPLQNKSATNSRSLSARDFFHYCFHPMATALARVHGAWFEQRCFESNLFSPFL